MQSLRQASLITAVKTPFTLSGEIDLDSYDQLVERQILAGVDGIIVGGTTGEGQLMSWDEHLMLIAHSAVKFGQRIKIIGNTGSNNTREAIKATESGFATGMHAALQINPYYGRTSVAGVRQHFSLVLDIGPAFIYNVPSRTGQDLTPETLAPILNHPNLVGIKECAGNNRIANYEQQGVACWSGNDDECAAGRHEHNSHGVISVTSNIVPELMRQLIDQPNDSLQQRLMPLMQWLFCEPNPIAINTALAMTGAIKPVFRLPYVPLTLAQRQQGLAILQQFVQNEIVGETLTAMNDGDFIISPI